MRTLRITAVLGVALVAASAGVSAASAASPATGASYSAFTQFSAKNNPNGTWSYLYGGTLYSGADTSKKICGVSGFKGWNTQMSPPDSATIATDQNGKATCTSNNTVIVPANYIEMDPESYANVDVEWTAPKNGTYTITGKFRGCDTGEASHPVTILYDGVSIYSNTISSYGQKVTFSLSQTVSAGDTISFENETGSTYNNLSTGLQATITKS
jgi:hypothetical protein